MIIPMFETTDVEVHMFHVSLGICVSGGGQQLVITLSRWNTNMTMFQINSVNTHSVSHCVVGTFV